MAEPARAAPVPKCTIHSATQKRKGTLAFFTADRSAPRGSLGYVAGDPQLPGGTRLTLAPRPPGLPPPPVLPTRGAWPGARLQAARCAPRASTGAASRSSSGPFEVVARTQRIPPGCSTKGILDRTLHQTTPRCPQAAQIGRYLPVNLRPMRRRYATSTVFAWRTGAVRRQLARVASAIHSTVHVRISRKVFGSHQRPRSAGTVCGLRQHISADRWDSAAEAIGRQRSRHAGHERGRLRS